MNLTQTLLKLKNKIKYWIIPLKIQLRIIKISPISWSFQHYNPHQIGYFIWDDVVWQNKTSNGNLWIPIIDDKVQSGMQLIFKERA